MRVSLRSTLTLVAVAALGFATGRYGGRAAPEQTNQSTIPDFTAAGPGSVGLPARSIHGQGQVPGTLRDIMRLRGDFAQTTALHVLASSMDAKGIERLLSDAASIQQASERNAATAILYDRYAELDPEAAIEHVTSRDDVNLSWVYGVFHTWARTDLEGALAGAAALDDRSRMAGGSAILRARDDLPPKEREVIATMLNLRVSGPESSALDLRTPEKAERSWRSALATEERDARYSKLHSLTDAWARQDPRAAMRAIESLRDRSMREQLLQQGLHAWSEKEPREAVHWALARPPSQERMQLLAATLTSLATREPSIAMDMTEGLSNAERQQILPQILMSWANFDAESAAAWAENLESAQLRSNSLVSVGSSYALHHPDEAFRWAASLPDSESQPVMSAVINQIAASDPARASGLVNHMNSGPERENVVLNIVQNWTQWDPQAALAWVSKLSASDISPSLYNSLFGQWAVHDLDAAIVQLSQIHDLDNRNFAIIGILGSPYLAPDQAERLYQRIEGADARRNAAIQLYYKSRESDPQAAERYRIEAGMPEDRDAFVPTSR